MQAAPRVKPVWRQSEDCEKESAEVQRRRGYPQAVELEYSGPWSSLQGAERQAKSSKGAADAEYRDYSCRGAGREAQCLA